ncbi:MAG: TIGR00159 family protein [Deltaproteobacteria bacterium]|nr:TIGR00159 family protein [Deltaproteobacteria bacterium]
MLGFLPSVRFADVLDILVVAFIIYWILLFVRGTRAVQMLYGLLLLMAMFILSKKLGMVTFQWLVGNFLGGLIIILVVIFQSEIRRGLAKMGQAPIFGRTPVVPRADFLDEMTQGAFRLADARVGAILLIEREMGLQEYVEHGKKLDALYSYELLASIFSRNSPIHDGAVVLRGDRVAAAGVILPIPADSAVSKTMGTRHRAAWGVSAETDAVSVVISEETGNVTVFHDRQMESVNGAMELREVLGRLFVGPGGKAETAGPAENGKGGATGGMGEGGADGSHS